MSRPLVIAGNWKMYKTIPEAVAFIESLASLWKESQAPGKSVEVLLAVPFTAIHAASRAAAHLPIKIGGQNMHDAQEGAFTGEVAGSMLRDAGATFVVLGHSERRHYFHESNEFIHHKVVRALQEKLIPILCIGETLEEREAGKTHAVLERQLKECLGGVTSHLALPYLMIAYEPVWAIGTGKTATPQMVESVHAFIKELLQKILGKKAMQQVRVLYGGSVKSDNIVSLLQLSDVDGALIGGASLSPEIFADMIDKAAPIVKEEVKVD